MAATKSQKLEDQAATAALYVTKGQSKKAPSSQSSWPLDEDNKLSSAGAAASLKYAQPRDLPSYPITGMPDPDSSAGAAASLANAHHKDFEYWKPESSDPANKAAMMAKDYKMAPLWHPEQSAAGSKAALLAQKEGGDVKIWRPESTDAGSSAAGQAMRKKGLSPNVNYGVTEEGEKKALLAATGAVSGSRKRSGSTPIVRSQYPDSENAASNALNAATIANRPQKKQQQAPPPIGPVIDAKKIHDAAVTNLSKEMYTSHPPVAPEIEEKNRQAGLRAAAVSMAKQMYEVQQKLVDDAAAGKRGDSHYAATSVHNRAGSIASSDESHGAPPTYVNLQEAAQKLAAERLAKLNDEHAAYRNYYGATVAKPTSKLSIRGRPRRRASSEGGGNDDDAERSKQIRSQMSLFQDNLAQVDAKKRQKDRESLLAAAQRNVRASMHGMDEKVFSETGKASPSMMEEWETKARARAQADSSARMTNHGKVHIGGGKYMDQSEVEAIASAKVQPTLDEVSAKAEQQRARDEAIRAEREERVRIQREKEEDQKLRDQMTKEEWKRFRDEEKREARAKKEEEKAKKAEEKRLRQEIRGKPGVATEGPEALSGNESEPPALAPIPKTEPISVEPAEPAEKPFIGPAIPSADEPALEPSTTTDTKVESITSDDPATSVEPASTTESASAPLGSLTAEMIAERVVSAPVDNEGAKSPPLPELLASASDPETHDAPKSSPAPTKESTVPAAPQTEASSTSPSKPAESVTNRIAPTIPAGPTPAPEQGTSKTTVTAGNSKAPEPKSEGKVSSWLKSKLRRTSKPAKPSSSSEASKEPAAAATTTSESAPPQQQQEKGFIGGATLAAAAAASNTSVNRSGTADSEREVAMAGKSSAPPAAAAAAPTNTSAAANDKDLYGASPAAAATQPQPQPRRSLSSSSISSLSSSGDDDEEAARGRTRLAREPKPMQHSLRTSMRGEGTGVEAVDQVPAAKGTGRNLDKDSDDEEDGDESGDGGGEQFEEARDTFDSEGLLEPPPKVGGAVAGAGVGGRASDSPVRDSKFSEDL